MAQYDLILTQNVNGSGGTEFSEKIVNLSKGSILSANASSVPTVLAAGIDGYMLVRDDNEATGLKWQVISAGHTQNTDTGTTNDTFTVDSDGTTGKIILDANNVGANYTTTIQNQSQAGNIVLTLPATTGTLALSSETHTQNTDTGTTSTVFELDSDGYKIELTAESASIFGIKVDGGGSYADLKAKDLTLSGNLTVNGTTTTINATTLQVDDKNIELGTVAVPDDTTADGGGITLKGATDKTILWDNANDNWTLNQNVNIPTGTTYKINNTTVLSATQVLGVTLGTMASATATDYVAKSVFDANTILYATADNTPLALTVTEQSIVGRKTGGSIAALSGADVMNVIWVTAPATKTSSGTAGSLAYDGNYFYVCDANNTWIRCAMATNW